MDQSALRPYGSWKNERWWPLHSDLVTIYRSHDKHLLCLLPLPALMF